MNKVNILLVGIGGYGGTYAREVIENPSEKINVAGVVEPFPERSMWTEEFIKRGINIYPDMESFYKEKSADLAVISTPIFLHTKHILSALENGSNVMCEKPLCADENDIEIMVQAQKKSGKFVSVGYQMSFSDAIERLKRDTGKGKYGKLLEMKTLVLRPRDKNYFGRGVGWAGKIKTKDGMLVYDSVANNSAAHYLYNMLHVMGEKHTVAEPKNVKAELLRANNIENFDISKIDFTIEGAKCSFIGIHPVNKAVEPIFEYRFEKGTVYYSALHSEEAFPLMPAEYTEYENIVGILENGEKIIYGNPNNDECRKLYKAVDDILQASKENGPCSIEMAAVHTKLINYIQKEYNVLNVRNELIKEENNLIYVDGLFEKGIECYKDINQSLLLFAE